MHARSRANTHAYGYDGDDARHEETRKNAATVRRCSSAVGQISRYLGDLVFRQVPRCA